MEILRVVAMAAILLVCSVRVCAAPATLTINGVDLEVLGESVDGVRLDESEWEFAPLFVGVSTTQISLSYDTEQADSDASPNTGTYSMGNLSTAIPEISLVANGNTAQISSFNDTPSGNDQFFASVEGDGALSSGVGLPADPVIWNVLLFGDVSMLTSDALPSGDLEWDSGNLSFDFTASGGTVRQVLIGFNRAPELDCDRPPTEPECESCSWPKLLILLLVLSNLVLLCLLILCRKNKG